MSAGKNFVGKRQLRPNGVTRNRLTVETENRFSSRGTGGGGAKPMREGERIGSGAACGEPAGNGRARAARALVDIWFAGRDSLWAT
jgi:hypothetical protein